MSARPGNSIIDDALLPTGQKGFLFILCQMEPMNQSVKGILVGMLLPITGKFK